MSRRLFVAAAFLSVPAAAQSPKPLSAQAAVAFFIEAQDVPPFTPEEMAERLKTLGDEPEAAAADAALNQWKQCVAEALVRWAPLNQGPGTLIDGAFGRCADIERDYRLNLVRMSPGGRQVIDTQLARNMTRTLEESWRPRLVAAVLEQMLARQAAAPQPATRTGAAPPVGAAPAKEGVKERPAPRTESGRLAGSGAMR